MMMMMISLCRLAWSLAVSCFSFSPSYLTLSLHVSFPDQTPPHRKQRISAPPTASGPVLCAPSVETALQENTMEPPAVMVAKGFSGGASERTTCILAGKAGGGNEVDSEHRRCYFWNGCMAQELNQSIVSFKMEPIFWNLFLLFVD